MRPPRKSAHKFTHDGIHNDYEGGGQNAARASHSILTKLNFIVVKVTTMGRYRLFRCYTNFRKNLPSKRRSFCLLETTHGPFIRPFNAHFVPKEREKYTRFCNLIVISLLTRIRVLYNRKKFISNRIIKSYREIEIKN